MVIMTDNFFNLLPNESKTVVLTHLDDLLALKRATLKVESYNADLHTYEIQIGD